MVCMYQKHSKNRKKGEKLILHNIYYGIKYHYSVILSNRSFYLIYWKLSQLYIYIFFRSPNNLSIYIELLFIENVKVRLTFHIKLVSFKNIIIFPIYGPKSIIFGAYAHIWAYSIYLILIKLYVFRRLVATSRAPAGTLSLSWALV